MKDKYTHMSVVIDRSGSMSSMKNDVIGGFNNLLQEQLRVEGTATMTLVRFDHEYEVVSDFVPLEDVKELNSETFQPRGNTALLDAMGKTLNDVRSKIHAMNDSEKPSRAIFVFITDGEENASTQYKKNQIFEMINDLRNKENSEGVEWEFIFIGANQDAIQEGSSYGVRANASLTYSASGDGARIAFGSLSRSISDYRSAEVGTKCCTFSEEDRKKQEELLDKKAKPYVTNGSNLVV